jgi:glycosyltransferase involved in cell wall biosynthesis
MKETLNVLQVVAAPPFNPKSKPSTTGPERRASNLAAQWRVHQIYPTICYPSHGNMLDNFKTAGLPVFEFDISSKLRLDKAVTLASIAKKCNANLIHTQGPASLDLVAALASKITGIPFILTRPVMIDDQVTYGRIRKATYNAIDRLATLKIAKLVVAVSKAGRTHLIEKCHLPSSKVVLIRNGIDLSRFALPNPKQSKEKLDTIHIGMVAQLFPPKGWDCFIACIKKLSTMGKNVIGHIIGDGPSRSHLESLTVEQGLSNRIVFHGYQEDIRPYLNSLDIFLFTSNREGLSVAILEAMAAGLPIVATNVGGIEEQVDEGVNGYICPPGDVDSLTEKASKLIQSPVRRLEFGEASRLKAEREFSEGRMLTEYVKAYRSVFF